MEARDQQMLIATEIRTAAWQHFQARFAEWMNSGILACWGAYLILHPGLFADPRVAAQWAGLNAAGAQQTWGLVALIVGLSRLGALWINGRHKRTPMVRLLASFFSAFILTQIVLGLWNSGVPNTGIIVYSFLVLADIYSAFRASADMTFVARQNETAEATESGRVVNITQRS